MVTVLDRAIDDNGYLKAIASPASISILNAPLGRISGALVSVATVLGHLNASGASITGFPLTPTFVFTGTLSGPTTFIQTPLVMPRTGQWSFVNYVTRTVASGASMYIDINRNGTSIFGAGTRPVIAAGGTFYSSASIATKNFNRGDRITWDFDGEGGGVGTITDFNIELVSE